MWSELKCSASLAASFIADLDVARLPTVCPAVWAGRAIRTRRPSVELKQIGKRPTSHADKLTDDLERRHPPANSTNTN